MEAQETVALTDRSLPGVKQAQKTSLITGLNQSVAILTDLAIGYKQAHWNMIGPDFVQLHELTDRLASEAHEHTDTAAERLRALGGVVDGTLQAAAEVTPLPEISRKEQDERVLVAQLLKRLDAAVATMRTSMEKSEDEPNTQDVYVEILRALEKDRWMLEAIMS
jgi:starvation-inducible DNA-binding protein